MITEYEVAFVLDANESVAKASLDKVRALFKEKGVEILSETDAGLKKLAYEVKRRNDGRYVFFRVKVEGTVVAPLSAELRLFEDVLKYLFIKQEYKKRRWEPKEGRQAAAAV